jgi:ribonuclease J
MAEKLKIIPLGGLNEIGKNLTVYEYGKDILIVDCGIGFPDDEMYGVDVVIPDISYLIKNASHIRAVLLTHGHEDHIGAMPYLLQQLNIPIYTTRMTAGLVKVKLEEFNLIDKTEIHTVEAERSSNSENFPSNSFISITVSQTQFPLRSKPRSAP